MNSPRYLMPENDRPHPVCPQCGGPLQRVHRHAIDMLVDTLIPVMRMRCPGADCAWEGLRRRLAAPHGNGGRRQIL